VRVTMLIRDDWTRLVRLVPLVIFTYGCHPAPQGADGNANRRGAIASSNALNFA